MKKFNFLSKLWSSVAGSQRNDVEFDRRLTVGSPSGFTINWTLKLVSVLVLVLTIGSGNAWGTNVTYSFDGDTSPTVTGTEPSGASSVLSGSYSNNSGWMQCANSGSAVLTLSGYKGYKITAITITVKSNKSSGTGSFSVVAGSTTIASIASSAFNTDNWNESWNNTSSGVTKTLTMTNANYEIKNGENVTFSLNVTSSGKSIYIKEWAITYEAAGGGTTPVTGVTVSPTSKSIIPGETFTITPTVAPAGATDQTVSWTSSATSKATVNSSGVVTGVASGTSTITCTTTDGGFTATCAVTVRGVTLQARDEDGNAIGVGGPGAPTRSGTTITAAANAGNYVFKQWDVTNATVAASGTTPTTISNPTGAVTVTAVYYKPITITYKANGSTFTTQTYARGGTLAFPASGPNGDAYSCTGKTFVGWVGEANKDYSHASIAPTYATAGGSVTAAATYYAVFATSAGELSNSYAAITSGLETANYVIAYSYNGGTQIVLKNAADNSSPSDKLEGYYLSLSASKYSNPGASYIWELQAQPDGSYYIYNANVDKYVNATTSTLTLSTTPTKFTISYDGTNSRWTIQIKDNSTYYVHGYVNSTAYDFRVSTSGSGNRYRIYLYKQESNITYSAYATTCSTEPRLNVTPTSLDFGNVANGTYKELTFSLTGSYLTANASIGVSGTNSSYFSVTPSSVSKGSGAISATDIIVRYTPGAVGDGHTATVTVTSGEAEAKTVTLTGNSKATYTVGKNAMTNGDVVADKTSGIMAGETVTLTIMPSSGYQLSSISAVDGSSNPVSLSGTGNSRTFTMPASNVTVTSAFVVRTDYVLVESALDDYSGEYLIAYRSSGTETLNVLSGRYNSKNSNTYGTYTNVWSYYDSGAKAIESNATTDAMKMVVEPGNISGRYTIYFANDNTYLAMTTGNKSTGTYLRFNENITSGYEYDWDFSWNTSSSVSEVAIHNNAASEGDKKWLWLLYNTGSPRFALYTSGADIELYKKVETCTKLDAPTGLAASSITQTSCTLSWNSVTNASGYEISLDNGSSWTSTSTNTSYNATGLTAGTTYNWKVRATGTGDYCDKGNAASSTVTMKNAVKVTYKTNGATGGQLPVAGGVVNLTEGDSHTILGNTGSGGSPTPLTKTGYVFDGWHSSSTYSSTPAYTIGSSITVNSNVDIYANWKPKKDTFVDAVHNTATQYGEGYNYTIPSCSDQTRNTSGTCEVTHYKFIGWALAGADLTNPANIIHAGDTQTASGTDASPKTYYAVWAEEL